MRRGDHQLHQLQFPIFNFTSPMGVLSRRTNGMCDSYVYTSPLYAFLPVEHVKPSFLRASGAASPKSIQRAVLALFPEHLPHAGAARVP